MLFSLEHYWTFTHINFPNLSARAMETSRKDHQQIQEVTVGSKPLQSVH